MESARLSLPVGAKVDAPINERGGEVVVYSGRVNGVLVGFDGC